MYVTREMVIDLEARYGLPEEIAREYAMGPAEFGMVRGSQKDGRSHDATLFIVDSGRVVVIRKPMYPEGAYRAPSGGVAPGENFEAGAKREAYEETGLRIELTRYVLRVKVRFTCEDGAIDWTTHVFAATPVGGLLRPVDTGEIVEARLATPEELRGPVRRALLASGSTGLRYRAELDGIVLDKLAQHRLLPAR